MSSSSSSSSSSTFPVWDFAKAHPIGAAAAFGVPTTVTAVVAHGEGGFEWAPSFAIGSVVGVVDLLAVSWIWSSLPNLKFDNPYKEGPVGWQGFIYQGTKYLADTVLGDDKAKFDDATGKQLSGTDHLDNHPKDIQKLFWDYAMNPKDEKKFAAYQAADQAYHRGLANKS